MTEHPPIDVAGHCYCGAIRFSVKLAADEHPIFTAYCHCDSCRRSHAAPLYHVVCVEERHFTVTAGEEHLVSFHKSKNAPTRAFCGRCGSRVLNRFGGWTPQGKTPLAFFPNLLDEEHTHHLPERFRPQKQNRPQECVLDRSVLEELFAKQRAGSPA